MGATASRLFGLITAATLPSTVAGIMFALERWDWQVLALVVILSLPLYLVGRDSTRAPSQIDEAY